MTGWGTWVFLWLIVLVLVLVVVLGPFMDWKKGIRGRRRERGRGRGRLGMVVVTSASVGVRVFHRDSSWVAATATDSRLTNGSRTNTASAKASTSSASQPSINLSVPKNHE